MGLLYNLFVKTYGLGIRVASIRNAKAQKWIKGRKNWRAKLREIASGNTSVFWFHAASLGEAEQGLPIIQKLKEAHPGSTVLLTFFSPSGYENFKNSAVDHTFYLPLDTPENARDFIDILKPRLALFIKYEIWFNYLEALFKKNVPTALAPALFRPGQVYFKQPFRRFALPILRNLDAILVQDHDSEKLLKINGFENVGVCGDTRVDRVIEIVNTPFKNDLLDDFTHTDKKVLVAGSTWPPDEKMFRGVFEKTSDLKMIIAPHDLSSNHLEELKKDFKGLATMFSTYRPGETETPVLIIDNMGMLSRLYRYGQIAYIGGGFGDGLHNSIEAAAYGMPVIFGPNHKNFVEPTEMIEAGFGHEVSDKNDLLQCIKTLVSDTRELQDQSQKARDYIEERAGAVVIIQNRLEAILTR